MATVKLPPFLAQDAQFLGSAFPQYQRVLGTNFPVPMLAFDAAAIESAFWFFNAINYGSGNVTCGVIWGSDTSTTTSHTTRWGAALAAVTPETDTGNIEAEAFATENTVDDDVLGTNAGRLQLATITISNLDSLAADDYACLRIRRVATHANDDMTGDALLHQVLLSYSDT